MLLGALAAAPADAQPVVQNAPPVQWVLTSGTVVVGTEVSEDAEFYTVQTNQGLVRIRKTDVARIDMHPAAGPSAPPVVSSEPPVVSSGSRPPAPLPAPRQDGGDGAESGGTLILEGVLVFGLSYGLTALVGALVSLADPDGELLFIPVTGPIQFGVAQEVANNDWVYLVIDSVCQFGGLVMILWGLITSGDDRSDASLEVAPWIAAGEGGLSARAIW
jgi:hypothetical protein